MLADNHINIRLLQRYRYRKLFFRKFSYRCTASQTDFNAKDLEQYILKQLIFN